MIKEGNFWRYTIGILLVVVCLLVIAIWDSGRPDNIVATQPIIVEPKKVENPEAKVNTNTVLNESVPENFPAPAKKLHKAMSGTQELPTNDELEIKTQALDQQLADLEAQLKAQGIRLPDTPQSTTNNGSDDQTTQARLEAIQQHMADKDKQ